jgi:outer membrane protein assembly factor BamB
MFRANLQRTGVFESEGVRRLRGVKWKFETERVVEAWFSSPSVSGGVIYFGGGDGYLYAVDAEAGVERWRFKARYRVYSSPAIADGTIYFGSDDGNLYALQ